MCINVYFVGEDQYSVSKTLYQITKLMTRCTSLWHLCFTIFFTLSFYPEVLYSPLVRRYMCPTVVTDISFGYKSFNEGLNGYLGQKNFKKDVILLKKVTIRCNFKDLTFLTGPNRWYSSLYDWQLDSSYLGHNISYNCECWDQNFVPDTRLS